jgi:hypothetical protein
MIKTTISIQKKIICNCSAYPYPHAVGQGLCKESLSEKPPFVAPKRGLASKLCKFIEDLEQEIENLEEVDAIAQLLKHLKADLSIGDREAAFSDFEHN